MIPFGDQYGIINKSLWKLPVIDELLQITNVPLCHFDGQKTKYTVYNDTDITISICVELSKLYYR